MSKSASADDDIKDRYQKFVPDDPDEHWVEYNRDRIERLANSDADDAWVFQRLLDTHEEGDS